MNNPIRFSASPIPHAPGSSNLYDDPHLDTISAPVGYDRRQNTSGVGYHQPMQIPPLLVTVQADLLIKSPLHIRFPVSHP